MGSYFGRTMIMFYSDAWENDDADHILTELHEGMEDIHLKT